VKAILGITFGLPFAFFIFVRADGPVNLAGEPPAAHIDVDEAHGRLEIIYLLVPEAKITAFADAFDPSGAVPNLETILKQTGAKVVANASTSLALGGDGAMLEIAESRLTLRPRISSPTQFHVNGRLTRSTFSSTFDVLLTPGQYQLFLLWDQPPHGGVKDPYNAVVARMREITVEGPNGEVGTMTTTPVPAPAPPTPALETIPPPPPLPKSGKVLYENRGDNTNGFVLKHPSNGIPNFSVHDHVLTGNYDRTTNLGWCELPVSVTGDFQVDFDVRADANDACSFLMLFDAASNQGVAMANSTNTSFGTHSLYIDSVKDLTDHEQIYYNHTVLASAESKDFPDQAWTHVRVSKIGNRLIDNVGGQVIFADLPPGTLPAKVHLGLGYYATKNVGGNGRIAYANIRVTPQL
jgi:hypothetical protein